MATHKSYFLVFRQLNKANLGLFSKELSNSVYMYFVVLEGRHVSTQNQPKC